MRVYGDTLLSAGDMAGDLTSSSQQLDFTTGCSVQALFLTGAPAGDIELQASLDNTNWDTITNSPYTIAGTGTFMWNLTAPNFSHLRCVFTAGGGSSGTLKVLFFSKGF
jgi:hypothetical protein